LSTTTNQARGLTTEVTNVQALLQEGTPKCSIGSEILQCLEKMDLLKRWLAEISW